MGIFNIQVTNPNLAVNQDYDGRRGLGCQILSHVDVGSLNDSCLLRPKLAKLELSLIFSFCEVHSKFQQVRQSLLEGCHFT